MGGERGRERRQGDVSIRNQTRPTEEVGESKSPVPFPELMGALRLERARGERKRAFQNAAMRAGRPNCRIQFTPAAFDIQDNHPAAPDHQGAWLRGR